MSVPSSSLSACTTIIPYESTEHFIDRCIINLSANPEDYSKILKCTNRRVESLALDLLQSDPAVSSTMGKVCIAYTGSDGRQEKFCPASPLDLIVIGKNDEDTRTAHSALENLAKKNPGVFFNHVTRLNSDEVNRFVRPIGDFVPTYALDAHHLSGPESLMEHYMKSSLEVITDCPNKDYKKFKSRLRGNVRILEKGIASNWQDSDPHFDLESGSLFYNGQYTKSTKYGHQRVVQYTLANHVFGEVRKGNPRFSPDFMKELPRQTSERLLKFHLSGMLNMNQTEVDALIDAYNKALRWYHLSQINYKKDCENKKPDPGTSITQVDPDELKEATRVIYDFSQKQGLFL